MVAGAAANQQQPPAALNLRYEVLDAAEDDGLILEANPAAHRIDHRLGLLEDLLLHEAAVVALHDLLNLHLQGDDLAGERGGRGPLQVALQSVDGEAWWKKGEEEVSDKLNTQKEILPKTYVLP